MNKNALRVAAGVAVAVIALAVGVVVRQTSIGERRQGVLELQQLVLPDPQGKSQALTQWRGKVLVVNFWATWCDPCREEVPALVRVQRKQADHGVQVVGIGVDSADKIRDFASKYQINYPLTVAGIKVIDTSRKLGNSVGGLPFTVILDRNGDLAATHLGGLTEAQLEQLLKPLLAS